MFGSSTHPRNSQVVADDDPLELLAASLRYLKPDTIRHECVTNRKFPSESIFQFEIYASIRVFWPRTSHLGEFLERHEKLRHKKTEKEVDEDWIFLSVMA